MAIFDEKIEIRERCKGVHCVDLGESFPTSIYLQKSASIQPRTSPSKFGRKCHSLFIRLLGPEDPLPLLEREAVEHRKNDFWDRKAMRMKEATRLANLIFASTRNALCRLQLFS